MSTETARDELARTLNKALEEFYEPFSWHSATIFAQRILAAGYRKPHVITTADELNSLPEWSVIQLENGTVWRTCGTCGLVMPAHETDADWARPISAGDFPVTVLHEPEPTP